MNKLAFLAAIALFPTLAAADGLVAGLGYAERDSIKGLEIEAGYRMTSGRAGMNILPLTGIWHSDSNSRFREETFRNGQTVCRDTSNGEFANDEKCSRSFSYAFIASADFALTPRAVVGAGVRIGEKTDPFATVRLGLSDKMWIQARAGGKYTSVGAGFSF